MEKRLTVQRNFQKRLIENIKKGDHRAERKKGVQYVKAGHIFRSKQKLIEGESASKFAAKFGIPGTPSIYKDSDGRNTGEAKVIINLGV